MTVLTVRAPERFRSDEKNSDPSGYRVRRFPVIRDKSGYVRGYLPYMSFDIPVFFRVLFGPKYDLIVAEPPPTTGAAVRLAAALRRTPYVYYAADIWSDASAQTGAPAWVVKFVAGLERFAMAGAGIVLSVSEGVTKRLIDWGVSSSVQTIGNGVDPEPFSHAAEVKQFGHPCFLYAGTASEWHGAGVFLEAMPTLLSNVPDAQLWYLGGGSEKEMLQQRAAELGVSASVQFMPALPAREIAPLLRGASAALGSLKPGAGYDFAFPTKLYSAAMCGAPMLFSGVGPAVEFVQTEVDEIPLGTATGTDVAEVAQAMVAFAGVGLNPARQIAVSDWAKQNVSLDAVAERAASCISEKYDKRASA